MGVKPFDRKGLTAGREGCYGIVRKLGRVP